MQIGRIKQLAGMVTEADEGAISLGLVFKINDPDNMRKAVDALLEAGMSVDLSYSMGTYFFTFKTDALAKEARAIVAKVIDKKKEAKWASE